MGSPCHLIKAQIKIIIRIMALLLILVDQKSKTIKIQMIFVGIAQRENVRKANSAMKTHQRTNTNQQINQYFNISDGKANLKIDQNQIFQSPDINPYREMEESPKRTYGLTSQEVNNLDIQDEHQDNLSSKLHQSILQQSQSIKDMKLVSDLRREYQDAFINSIDYFNVQSQVSHQSSIRVNKQAIKKSPSSGISENNVQQAIYSSYNQAKPQVKKFKQVTSNTGTNSKYISLNGSPPNFPISYSNQPSQSSSLFGFDLAMIGNKLTDVLGMNKERMFNNPVLLKDYQQGPNTHRLNNNSQQFGYDNARNNLPQQQKNQNNYDFSKLVKDSEYYSPVASQRNAQQDSTAQASRFVNRNIPQHQKNDTTHEIVQEMNILKELMMQQSNKYTLQVNQLTRMTNHFSSTKQNILGTFFEQLLQFFKGKDQQIEMQLIVLLTLVQSDRKESPAVKPTLNNKVILRSENKLLSSARSLGINPNELRTQKEEPIENNQIRRKNISQKSSNSESSLSISPNQNQNQKASLSTNMVFDKQNIMTIKELDIQSEKQSVSSRISHKEQLITSSLNTEPVKLIQENNQKDGGYSENIASPREFITPNRPKQRLSDRILNKQSPQVNIESQKQSAYLNKQNMKPAPYNNDEKSKDNNQQQNKDESISIILKQTKGQRSTIENNQIQKTIEQKIKQADIQLDAELEKRKKQMEQRLQLYFFELCQEIRQEKLFSTNPQIQQLSSPNLFENCKKLKVPKDKYRDYIIMEFKKHMTVFDFSEQSLQKSIQDTSDANKAQMKHRDKNIFFKKNKKSSSPFKANHNLLSEIAKQPVPQDIINERTEQEDNSEDDIPKSQNFESCSPPLTQRQTKYSVNPQSNNIFSKKTSVRSSRQVASNQSLNSSRNGSVALNEFVTPQQIREIISKEQETPKFIAKDVHQNK
eukprot:403361096